MLGEGDEFKSILHKVSVGSLVPYATIVSPFVTLTSVDVNTAVHPLLTRAAMDKSV